MGSKVTHGALCRSQEWIIRRELLSWNGDPYTGVLEEGVSRENETGHYLNIPFWKRRNYWEEGKWIPAANTQSVTHQIEGSFHSHIPAECWLVSMGSEAGRFSRGSGMVVGAALEKSCSSRIHQSQAWYEKNRRFASFVKKIELHGSATIEDSKQLRYQIPWEDVWSILQKLSEF